MEHADKADRNIAASKEDISCPENVPLWVGDISERNHKNKITLNFTQLDSSWTFCYQELYLETK